MGERPVTICTQEQKWQHSVCVAKRLRTHLDKGILWADDKIKALEKEVSELKKQERQYWISAENLL